MEKALKDLILSRGKLWFGIDVDPNWIQFQPTRKDVRGDLTLMVFPLAKALQKSPVLVGQQLGGLLKSELSFIEDYEVIQGFLNVVFSQSIWKNELASILNNEAYGITPAGTHPMVMVEYASPNTNKPLHLGHLRNIFQIGRAHV